MAAATVRSRWPGSAASPRPKRRRRKRPPPPQQRRSRRPRPPAAARSCSPELQAAQAFAAHAASAADSVCSDVPSSRPELAPDVARQRRGVAAQQGAQHDLRRAAWSGARCSWSARAITTSHCLTRLSLTAACSVSRSRSAFTASVSGDRVGARLDLERRQKLACVSARSLRARSAAALAAARTSATCSRRASISTGSRLACSARVAMRSSWRVHSSTSWRERPLRRRSGLGQRRAGAAPAAARSHSQARWESARRPRSSVHRYSHGVGRPVLPALVGRATIRADFRGWSGVG